MCVGLKLCADRCTLTKDLLLSQYPPTSSYSVPLELLCCHPSIFLQQTFYK